MYNHQLDYFLAVADSGSFSSAGEALHLSSTAVMKQINSLEAHLGLHLFERTAKGVSLTSAGQSLYQDAHFFKAMSHDSLLRAKEFDAEGRFPLRIGCSMLHNGKELIRKVADHPKFFREFSFSVQHYDTHDDNPLRTLRIPKTFDLFTGVCDMKPWTEKNSSFPFCRKKISCLVPSGHILAEESSLSFEQLSGERLLMPQRDMFESVDLLRVHLCSDFPDIHLQDTASYDIFTFNMAYRDDAFLLALDSFTDLHPGFVNLPLQEDFYIPYGILCEKKPPEPVRRFLKLLHEID